MNNQAKDRTSPARAASIKKEKSIVEIKENDGA